MYAEVIIDQRSHAVDRPFDYEIPERLVGSVRVG